MLEPGVIGVITARGGSKSVPKKNIAMAGGKPLIAWTIEAALQSRSLTSVIVSTDDEEIANVAIEWGAEAPFKRPKKLAEDDSDHVSVMIHAIHWLEFNRDLQPEYMMLLQPTSPLRTTEDIDGAVDLALEKGADSVVSVSLNRDHPYLTKQVEEDGTLVDFVSPPAGYLRRQALPPVYSLNGAIYLTRRNVILDQETFHPVRTFPYIMPPDRSLDVDDPWDLHLVNLVLENRNVPSNR